MPRKLKIVEGSVELSSWPWRLERAQGWKAQTIYESEMALFLWHILNSDAPPAIRFNRDIPPKLEDIISKALEKDRNLRYQSAAEMRTDLQRLKRDTETGRVRAASSGNVAAVQDSGSHAAVAAPTPVAVSSSAALATPSSSSAAKSAEVPVTQKKSLWKIVVPVAVVVALIAGGFCTSAAVRVYPANPVLLHQMTVVFLLPAVIIDTPHPSPVRG